MSEKKLCLRCRWIVLRTNKRGGIRYFCTLKREDLGTSVLWRKACALSEPGEHVNVND